MFTGTRLPRATDARQAWYIRISFATALIFAPGTLRAANETTPAYETVVVAPAPVAFESKVDEAASAAVVSQARTPRSGETVPQLLAELPGTAVTRYGGMGSLSMLSIRGSAPNQVQVYVDDVPLNLATGGGVDLGFLPVWGMDRLQVFKGASPIAFGASGVGGVVALQTQTPEADVASGALGVGSWGSRTMSVSGGTRIGRVRTFAALSLQGYRGDFPYADDNGTPLDPANSETIAVRTNNDLAQQDGVVRAVVPLESGRALTISGSFNRRRQGVPGVGYRQSPDTRLALDRQTAQLAYETGIGQPLALHTRTNLYILHVGQSFSDPTAQIAQIPTHTDDDNVAFGATSRLSKAIGSWLRLRTMLDARHETFTPRDDVAATPTGPPGTRTYVAAGAEPGFWIRQAQLEITPSARLEGSRDVLTSRNQFTQEPTASDPSLRLLPVVRLSLLHRPAEWVSFRANGGRYVRAPSTTERYGNTGFVLPNPLLRPESGINADVGARVQTSGRRVAIAADVSVFASQVDDLIQYTRSGPNQSRAVNVRSARIVGAEAGVDLQAFRIFHTVGQVTFTDARDTSDIAASQGKQLPYRPRLRAYLRPEVRDLRLGSGLRGGVYLDADLTSGNHRDPANTMQIPRRLLFGAGAHVGHAPSGVRLVASAMNLADAATLDLIGYPLPPRTFFLSLEWTMTFSPSSASSADPQGDS